MSRDQPPPPSWPPLVDAQGLPAWVRARDVLLTAAAWAVLGWMLQDLWEWGIDLLTPPYWEATFTTPPDWRQMASDLRPFLQIAALLLVSLLLIAVKQRRTLRQQLDSAAPPALSWSEQAQGLPLEPAERGAAHEPAWREGEIDVAFDAAGGFRRAPTPRRTET